MAASLTSLTITKITSTSITLSCSILGTTSTKAKYRGAIYYTINGEEKKVTTSAKELEAKEDYEFTKTIYSLDSNTKYAFDFNIEFQGLNEEGKYTGEWVETKLWEDTTGMTHWKWTTSESSAFKSQGKFSVLTAKRWNELVEAVDICCQEKRDKWNTSNGKYYDKENTKVDPGDIMTAKIFNSLKMQIGSRVSTGITDRIPGEEIKGEYFITLGEKLNDWIDILFKEEE